MEYPTDIALNKSKDVFLDKSNDLAIIGGKEQLQQSVAIDVFDETTAFVGSPIDGSTVGLLEEEIRQSLNDDPQLGEIRSVSIDSYDRTLGRIELSISVVEDEDFTLPVNIT